MIHNEEARMDEVAKASRARETRTVASPLAHLAGGAGAGVALGGLIGTVLAICITLWNELRPASAIILLFVYLGGLYAAVVGIGGGLLGAATALLSRVFSRPVDRASLFAFHAATITGAACFVYTARRFTFGLYFEDHPLLDSYGAMLAYYLLLVGLWGVLALATAAMTFAALRLILRRVSVPMFIGTAGALCGVALAGVVITQALGGNPSAQAASTRTRAPLAPASAAAGDGHRVVVIGLDGATWSVLQPLMAQGRAPVLERMARHGTTASLATLSPTLSPIIWTSIATGTLPEKHRIQAFAGLTAPGISVPVQRVPGFVGLAETLPRVVPNLVRTHLITGAQRRTKPLWAIASEQQRRVGVINWYVSYPAEPVQGVMVSDRTYESLVDAGALSPAAGTEPYTYPATLIPDLAPLVPPDGERLVGDLRHFVPADAEEELRAGLAADTNGPLGTLGFHHRADTFYRNVAKLVQQQVQPDLMLLYLKGIDRIEHHFWKWRDPQYFRGVSPEQARKFGAVIDNYYAFTDALLGDLLAQLDPDTTVFVLSDHGHGPAFNAEGLSGNHGNSPDGIFIAHGPNVRAGARLTQASVLDIAPTALAAMGLPVARDLDGRVLTDIFTPGFLQRTPIRSVETFGLPGEREETSPDTPLDEGIKERLRALGYLN